MLDLSAIRPGMIGTADLIVAPEHTAPRVGSGRIAVLATPVMINVIEAAALAAVEPLLPGLTDTRANLAALLDALAEAGVRHVCAGYAFLRPAARAALHAALQGLGLHEPVLGAYEGGPVLRPASQPPAQFLPRPRRQRGYSRLMALAAEKGLTVSISNQANPDFDSPRPAARRSLRDEALLLF